MITVTEDVNSDSSEVHIQGSSERNIIGRFWDLRSDKRQQVMIELGKLAKGDVIADELRQYHDALMAIAKEERVNELVKIITDKEAES